MHWTSEQIERYLESPEYFDSAVIPCYRIGLTEETKGELEANEEQMARMLELEERLKGRIVLFPALVVFGSNDIHINAMIESTIEAMHKFKYIIFIPFDDVIAAQMQPSFINNRGHMLSATHRVDWFLEIVAIWNQR